MTKELLYVTIPVESTVDDGFMIKSQGACDQKCFARIQLLIATLISLSPSIFLVSVGFEGLANILHGIGSDFGEAIALCALFISCFIPCLFYRCLSLSNVRYCLQ